MIRSALRSVGAYLMSVSEPTPQRPPARATKRRKFEQRSRELIEDRRRAAAPITAGTIQLLGLGDIMSALKSRYADVAGQARTIAETAIEEHLSPDDSYQLQGEETYVICFARLDEAAAAQIAKLISARIAKLLETDLPDAAKAIQVGHFVASVDSSTFDDRRPLADQLVESLEEIRCEADEAVTQRRAALIRDAQILFRPMWYAKKDVVSLYRCMLDGESGNSAIEHLKVMSSPEELQEALAELDCLVLARGLKALHALLQKQATAIFVIPVHFQTVAEKTQRGEYLKLCESIPPAYRKFVSFEVYGIPAETTSSRIEQIVGILQPFCKALAVEVPAGFARLGELGTANLWAISFNLDGKADAEALKFAVRIVHSQNLRAIAHGVNTYGQLGATLEAGFDYAEGAAVIASVEIPRGTFNFRPARMPGSKPPALAV